jgi:hypothetical protein
MTKARVRVPIFPRHQKGTTKDCLMTVGIPGRFGNRSTLAEEFDTIGFLILGGN